MTKGWVIKLVRATLIMFRDFNIIELTFCVDFIMIFFTRDAQTINYHDEYHDDYNDYHERIVLVGCPFHSL